MNIRPVFAVELQHFDMEIELGRLVVAVEASSCCRTASGQIDWHTEKTEPDHRSVFENDVKWVSHVDLVAVAVAIELVVEAECVVAAVAVIDLDGVGLSRPGVEVWVVDVVVVWVAEIEKLVEVEVM